MLTILYILILGVHQISDVSNCFLTNIYLEILNVQKNKSISSARNCGRFFLFILDALLLVGGSLCHKKVRPKHSFCVKWGKCQNRKYLQKESIRAQLKITSYNECDCPLVTSLGGLTLSKQTNILKSSETLLPQFFVWW